MSKIAFVFPGQGAQFIGMGKEFYDNFSQAKEIFDMAKEATGIDVASLCFEENEKINQTEYTQLAILTTELAILKVVEDLGITADYAAGLSLGEYAALALSKAIDYKALFKLIRARGIYMQNAYPEGGAMAAILGAAPEMVASICAEVDGIVSIANDNCPGQIVISGEQSAVDKACEALKEAGAKRCVPLKVSGPFHSELIKSAGEKLGTELSNVTINDIEIPYLSNVTADVVASKDDVRDLLVRQVSSQVRFRESILKMVELGVDTFIEIGPGKTVQGFVKKTCQDVTIMGVEKVSDLENLKATF